MNDKQKFIKNLFATLIITVIWCFIWMTLEILIDGYTTDRVVDNIMTLTLMPSFTGLFLSDSSFLKKAACKSSLFLFKKYVF